MMQIDLIARIVWWAVCLLVQDSTPLDPADDEAGPLIFLPLMLLVIAICLVLIGIGSFLALVGVACAAILVALGIISSSAVVALFRRRALAGLRAFHYQVCVAIAAPAGVTLFWVATKLFDLEMRLRSVVLVGTATGLAAGLLLAGIFDWTMRVAYRRLLSARDLHGNATQTALPRLPVTDGSPGRGRRRA